MCFFKFPNDHLSCAKRVIYIWIYTLTPLLYYIILYMNIHISTGRGDTRSFAPLTNASAFGLPASHYVDWSGSVDAELGWFPGRGSSSSPTRRWASTRLGPGKRWCLTSRCLARRVLGGTVPLCSWRGASAKAMACSCCATLWRHQRLPGVQLALCFTATSQHAVAVNDAFSHQ